MKKEHEGYRKGEREDGRKKDREWGFKDDPKQCGCGQTQSSDNTCDNSCNK